MGKEKRIHHQNRCQWTTLLRSFSSERGNNQQVFPPPWSEFSCGHPRTSKAVRGCRSIRLTEQHQLPLRSLSTEVHFHCLTNFCVCLKHTLCLGKGLSFPFGGPNIFDHVDSSLLDRDCSVQQEPPWVLYISVYSRDEEKERRDIVPNSDAQCTSTNGLSKGTFCQSWPTTTGWLPLLFVTFLFSCVWIRWSRTYCWGSRVTSPSYRCTDLPLCVGCECLGINVCMCVNMCVCAWGETVCMFMGVCRCACKHKLERAYLCMHACSRVRMPLLRVCVCAFL